MKYTSCFLRKFDPCLFSAWTAQADFADATSFLLFATFCFSCPISPASV